MSVLVVGSVAYDSVTTPAGSREAVLGGSATYFSVASSYFTPVSVVAVVGEDFQPEHIQLLEGKQVDISGLERKPGLSFRWTGVYGGEDVNTRDTLDTQLNVFAEFSPSLSSEQKQMQYVFLANIDPDLQFNVLEQLKSTPKLVAMDTMNFWIRGKSEGLRKVLEKVDVLFVDEGEIRDLTGEVNLVAAAKKVMGMGPSVAVVKRGASGVLLVTRDSAFATPAFPLDRVVDPTGAGDSFAGGFLGYLASTGDLSSKGFRRATALGSVMGSFAVESFSLDRLVALTQSDIEFRFRSLSELVHFVPLGDVETLPWRPGN